MPITQSTLESQIEQAQLAIDNDDFNLARKWITKAELSLNALPDYGIGNRYIRYRTQISSISKALDRLESSTPSNQKSFRVHSRYSRW